MKQESGAWSLQYNLLQLTRTAAGYARCKRLSSQVEQCILSFLSCASFEIRIISWGNVAYGWIRPRSYVYTFKKRFLFVFAFRPRAESAFLKVRFHQKRAWTGKFVRKTIVWTYRRDLKTHTCGHGINAEIARLFSNHPFQFVSLIL